jgi:hypothetical protein
MAKRTEILKDVPPGDVKEVMQDFKDAGAISVTKKKQDDGNYTITAVFSS